MTLDVEIFLRRLSMDVLPKGFTKIRHYGILSNRNRKEKIERCEELLEGVREGGVEEDREEDSKPTIGEGGTGLPPCPHCGKPVLEVISDSVRPC